MFLFDSKRKAGGWLASDTGSTDNYAYQHCGTRGRVYLIMTAGVPEDPGLNRARPEVGVPTSRAMVDYLTPAECMLLTDYYHATPRHQNYDRKWVRTDRETALIKAWSRLCTESSLTEVSFSTWFTAPEKNFQKLLNSLPVEMVIAFRRSLRILERLSRNNHN
jgi:hypothetical protein